MAHAVGCRKGGTSGVVGGVARAKGCHKAAHMPGRWKGGARGRLSEGWHTRRVAGVWHTRRVIRGAACAAGYRKGDLRSGLSEGWLTQRIVGKVAYPAVVGGVARAKGCHKAAHVPGRWQGGARGRLSEGGTRDGLPGYGTRGGSPEVRHVRRVIGKVAYAADCRRIARATNWSAHAAGHPRSGIGDGLSEGRHARRVG